MSKAGLCFDPSAFMYSIALFRSGFSASSSTFSVQLDLGGPVASDGQ